MSDQSNQKRKEIGEKIKYFRERLKISQNELAIKIGKSSNSIHKILELINHIISKK